jgi:peptide/nickel transport system substrate-binding protein
VNIRRRASLATLVATAAAAIALSACGRALPTAASLADNSSGASAAAALSPTTDPPTKDDTKPIVWATYREVQTLDPVQAFDYPEDTVDTALCDSLLRQQPDGSITSGLATATYPNPTTLVLNLRSGPRFWDGHPVTAADVVWSLQRAASTTSGSFYPAVFIRVKSIAATSPTAVTIHLKQPDYWLTGELSQMSGIVLEKAYGEKEGKKLGTPQGLTMCSGPYMIKKWIPGQGITIVANPHYWDSTTAARVRQITIKGVGDTPSLTSGLLTGGIQGSYAQNISTLAKLTASKNLTVSFGPSFALDALVVSNLKGTLKDVRVRQALSMAIDRSAYINAIYHGHAQLPRADENPGAWGYGKEVFQRDWARLPVPRVDIAKAKELIKAAGAQGKTITIGTTQEIENLATSANIVRQAAEQIGLNVQIKSVSAANFINFFTDAKARAGIDMFPTVNYPDYGDPAGLYNTFALPGGSQNFDNYSNPQITKLLGEARSTANPDLRASLVAKAGDIIAQQQVWIPMAAPDSLLITSRQLTGAPTSFVYMGGPWANLMGGR